MPIDFGGGFVRCQRTYDLKLQASSCQAAVITIPPRGGGAYPIIALDQETVGRQPWLFTLRYGKQVGEATTL